MRQARGSRGSQRGATAIEYGILIGLVGVAVIASVSLLGGNLSDSFCNTADSIGEQNCAQGASASDSAAGTGSDSTAGATGGTENPGGGAVSAEPSPNTTMRSLSEKRAGSRLLSRPMLALPTAMVP